MTLQNRVSPFGALVATPARGTMFGNRGGCFHDGEQRLTRRRWASGAWICCELEYKGNHIERLMAPGHYTELFFLDEATALAAGHRPCFLCRRADAVRFQRAWFEGNREALALERVPRAPAIDAVLHGERLAVVGKRDIVPSPRPSPAAAGEGEQDRLPEIDVAAVADGVMVMFGDDPGGAWLVWGGLVRRWSFEGYGEVRPAEGKARLLTPPSAARAIAAGYVPRVHASAG
ncbi:MAG: hypothetical protein IT303_09255 [Dehalococcoidia bacterium]|nr:hypothetical protein [Dehalococcoidia bacterium]